MSKVVPDFEDSDGRWVKYYYNEDGKFMTNSGMVWQDMNSRCKVGSRFQEKHPSYVGCLVSDEFKDFQQFTNWHTQQVGYGMENYQLDKDLLNPENKVYCREFCVIVPRQLNTFIGACDAKRGLWPQGVYLEKSSGKFKAQISISGKKTTLGRYFRVEDAYNSYKQAKEAEAYRWYKRLVDREFIVDNRVIERMRTWTLDK